MHIVLEKLHLQGVLSQYNDVPIYLFPVFSYLSE